MNKPAVAIGIGLVGAATVSAIMDAKLEDSNVAKSELEHYAARKIKALQDRIEELEIDNDGMKTTLDNLQSNDEHLSYPP